MNHQNLRSLHEISYNEPVEPSLHEYAFCRECQEYVLENCSIHGPLLVVPNSKKEENFLGESPQMQFSGEVKVEHCPSDKENQNDSITIKANTDASEASEKPTDEDLTNCLAILEQFSSSNLMNSNQRKETQIHPLSSLNVTEDDIREFMLVNGLAPNSENLVEKDSNIKRIQTQLDEEIMRDIEAEAKIFAALQISNTFRENLCKEQSKKLLKNKPHISTSTQMAQNEVFDNNEESSGIGIKSKRKLQITKKSITTKKPKFQNTNEDAAETDLNSETNLKKNTIVIKKQNFQEPFLKNIVDMNSKRKSKDVVPKKQKTKTQNNYNYMEKGKAPILNTITAKFKCNECGIEFFTRDILANHNLKCIKPKSLVKDSQLKKGDTLNSLLSEVYNCDICTFKTNQKRSIKTHLKMHSTTKGLSCDICEYRCARKSILKDHIRTHTGEKPFTCNICEFRCARKTILNNHKRTHTGEKPFTCNVCEFKCARNNILERHKITHTGEKPFSCNVCEYRFTQKSHLKDHIRTHTGEKPFLCNICEYRCATKSTLKVHIRTHTGEKPFCCNICEYRCARTDDLKSHMRTHTGEKRFSCNICEYRCSQKSRLKDHIRTHTGEKPFACNICEFRCARKSILNKHIKRHR